MLQAVRERGDNGNGNGNGNDAGSAVESAAWPNGCWWWRCTYRTNLTMRQLAPLFGISSFTVCRVIPKLGPLLALEPLSRPADAAERLWIVDGTLVPVRDRHIGAASRNYRYSANVHRPLHGPAPGWSM